jgi:hypothetical protein
MGRRKNEGSAGRVGRTNAADIAATAALTPAERLQKAIFGSVAPPAKTEPAKVEPPPLPKPTPAERSRLVARKNELIKITDRQEKDLRNALDPRGKIHSPFSPDLNTINSHADATRALEVLKTRLPSRLYDKAATQTRLVGGLRQSLRENNAEIASIQERLKRK